MSIKRRSRMTRVKARPITILLAMTLRTSAVVVGVRFLMRSRKMVDVGESRARADTQNGDRGAAPMTVTVMMAKEDTVETANAGVDRLAVTKRSGLSVKNKRHCSGVLRKPSDRPRRQNETTAPCW